MRILIAHAFYRIPGGEDRYVEQQVELLGSKHEVELVRADNAELSSPLQAAGRMLRPGGFRSKLEERVSSFDPDLIHVHNIYPSIGAAVHDVARRKRLPLAMTVHNHRLRCPNGYRFTGGRVCDRCVGGNHVHAVLHPCFPSKAQATGYATALWIDRFVRKLEDAVGLFVAPSTYMSNQLAGWGIAGERIRLIRNFTTSSPANDLSARRGGAYAGRLSSEKGLDVLLHALASSGDPEFEIFGDGPLRDSLESLAGRLGLRHTRFRGRVDGGTLRDALERARYFVMPSLSDENAPLAVLEAMAAGAPPIVTRRGGLPELASSPELVVAPGDSKGLAAAIGRLVEDDELQERAARAAVTFASEHLSPSKHLGRLEALYRELLAGSAAP